MLELSRWEMSFVWCGLSNVELRDGGCCSESVSWLRLGLSVVGAFNILLPLALFTLLLFFGLLAIGGISLLELDE